VSNQPEYSYLQRSIEAEVVPACIALGLSQVVWSPLAQGLLTGKYAGGRIPHGSRGADEQRNKFLRPMLTPANLARAAHLAAVAAEVDLTPAQLALAWVLAQPNISAAITSATRVEQLHENLAAANADLAPGTLERLAQPPGG
jgi:aryl-alcohol dehydrogenase-like predicted oxidoreductase